MRDETRDYMGEAREVVPGQIIASGMLSQGDFTSCCGLVLYQHESNTDTPFIVHTINFDNGSLISGHYFKKVDEAYTKYIELVEIDQRYIRNGTPISGLE